MHMAALIARLGLPLLTLGAVPAQAQFYQCVTFARDMTGVTMRGNANTWWAQAAGHYARGQAPKTGAILAFRGIPGMPMGHVAVVAKVIGAREILLDHANWSQPGRIERGVRAMDVSANGDWSQVRVWYGGIGDMGTRINPTFGFIYPDRASPVVPVAAPATIDRAPLVSADVIRMAMREQSSGAPPVTLAIVIPDADDLNH
jgi:hypothetical protein